MEVLFSIIDAPTISLLCEGCPRSRIGFGNYPDLTTVGIPLCESRVMDRHRMSPSMRQGLAGHIYTQAVGERECSDKPRMTPQKLRRQTSKDQTYKLERFLTPVIPHQSTWDDQARLLPGPR